MIIFGHNFTKKNTLLLLETRRMMIWSPGTIFVRGFDKKIISRKKFKCTSTENVCRPLKKDKRVLIVMGALFSGSYFTKESITPFFKDKKEGD